MDREEDNHTMKKSGKKHFIQYNLNPSNQLLVEEALKKCLAKYGGLGIHSLKSKYAPKNKQSPFGDFPKEYLPKKDKDYTLVNIESHQVANSSSNFKNTKGFNRSEAFTSLVKQTTEKPPRAGAINPRKITVSDFRLHYDRGDLPIFVEHDRGTKIKWKESSFEKFNFQLYLPIFIDGIREKAEPYRFLSIQGTFDILDNIHDNVVKVIPQLILPLKSALNTRDVEVIGITLKVYLLLIQVIQKLILSSELAGEALVPYYRQILPIFNLYKNQNKNIGDHIDYNQRKKKTLGDLIQETLELMEIHGGDVIYIIILGCFY